MMSRCATSCIWLAEPIGDLTNSEACVGMVGNEYRLFEALEGQFVIDYVCLQADLTQLEIINGEFLN